MARDWSFANHSENIGYLYKTSQILWIFSSRRWLVWTRHPIYCHFVLKTLRISELKILEVPVFMFFFCGRGSQLWWFPKFGPDVHLKSVDTKWYKGHIGEAWFFLRHFFLDWYRKSGFWFQTRIRYCFNMFWPSKFIGFKDPNRLVIQHVWDGLTETQDLNGHWMRLIAAFWDQWKDTWRTMKASDKFH